MLTDIAQSFLLDVILEQLFRLKEMYSDVPKTKDANKTLVMFFFLSQSVKAVLCNTLKTVTTVRNVEFRFMRLIHWRCSGMAYYISYGIVIIFLILSFVEQL